jgi:hypothetical protein
MARNFAVTVALTACTMMAAAVAVTISTIT